MPFNGGGFLSNLADKQQGHRTQTHADPRTMLSVRSAKQSSGSIIQNSAKWRDVCESSARNVGPKVYTSDMAQA